MKLELEFSNADDLRLKLLDLLGATTHVPTQISSSTLNYVLILIHNNDSSKIQAIKAVRALTNCGLKKAKDIVDSANLDWSRGLY